MPGAHLQQHTLGDGLVPLINRLQDIFSQAGVETMGGDLELPQIAVVGKGRTHSCTRTALHTHSCTHTAVHCIGGVRPSAVSR
jgi:hypothetical protein